MRAVKTRGRAGKALARLALGAAVLVVLFMTWTSAAVAMPVGQQFVPTQTSVLWSAVPAGGAEESSPVTVDIAEVAPGDELSDPSQLTAKSLYLYVALHLSYEFGGALTPIEMPPTEATLLTAQGIVTGLVPPASYGVDASWYFPVTASMTTATLEVASFSKVLGNERGDFINWNFSPTPIDLVGHATRTDSASANGVASNVGRRADSPDPRGAGTGGGVPLPAVLGVSLGGIAILGAGSAGLVSLTRRRAFYRADREGRVVLTGPPVGGMVGAAGVVGAAGLPSDRHGIVVKLLGWLEVEGTKGPITAGPLLEIIVFLVLNPGRSFTSVQLRESIWGLGRKGLASNTFRNYMVGLRKALGPGVVVTEKYRYEMTGVVTSDLDQFRTALRADDPLSGSEEALELVRGPVLYGCFDTKKNAPFEWAVEPARNIEDEITTVAVDVAFTCLKHGDARRAAKATAKGLLCAPSDLRLRRFDLQVGAAIGGASELGRRLAAARAAIGNAPLDVAELEELAGQLGWAAPVPG
jgi:DNA-binding SARP family transcriptional activator